MTEDYETNADRGAYEEQCNGHEPKRDCGGVNAHRPSPLAEVALGCERRASHQTSSIIAPGAFGRMRPYAEIQRIDFAVTVDLVGQSGRPPSPNLAARITRAYKLRQQPVEPRQRVLLGVLFCDGQSIFSSSADFPGVCVVAATLLVYSR
jgi:hypothetical protein